MYRMCLEQSKIQEILQNGIKNEQEIACETCNCNRQILHAISICETIEMSDEELAALILARKSSD